MKRILTAVSLFFLAGQALAADTVGIGIAVVVPYGDIQAAYTDVGAETHSGLIYKTGIAVFNSTDAQLALCVYGKTVPADCTDDVPMPASSTIALDNYGVSSNVYLRYRGSAPTTGEAIIIVK